MPHIPKRNLIRATHSTTLNFEEKPIKRENFLCYIYCFARPSTACVTETNQPIFMGLSTKCGIKNA